MAIIATNKGGSNREPIPAGTYMARCYQMIHIGTVTELIQGQEKTLNKVRITWELPTELKEFKEGEGEKPYSISKEFTLSMNEKATLRKFLASWRGKDFTEEQAKSFDIVVLLGVECVLSIIHKPSKDGSKMYEEISSVSRPMKGSACPPAINETRELTYSNFDWDFFNTLPDFIKDKMKLSVEFKQLSSPGTIETPPAHKEEDEGDLPF